MPPFRVVMPQGASADLDLTNWVIDHLWPALRQAPPGTIVVLARERHESVELPLPEEP